MNSRSFISRAENWFAAPEPNAAGRMGLYRILYGIWFLWLLTEIDFQSFAMRPSPPPNPVGIIKLLVTTPAFHDFQAVLFWVAFVLSASLVTLTFGLLTRLSTALVFIGSAILFSWDSSFGKVIDKYVLLGNLIPFWMLFSRWGETYSVDSLIRRASGLPVTQPSDCSWRHIWPMRAIMISIVLFYFSAGYMKLVPGTWLHNPYVVLDKLTGNLIEAWTLGRVTYWDEVLYGLVVHVPFVFITGQYLALAFECLFPLAIFHRTLRTLMFSMAALFHTMTIVILGIGFAPMIIALAIIVDWQAIHVKYRPFRFVRPVTSKTGLTIMIALILVLAYLLGAANAFSDHYQTALNFLPNQKYVWFAVFPFAFRAFYRSVKRLIRRHG